MLCSLWNSRLQGSAVSQRTQEVFLTLFDVDSPSNFILNFYPQILSSKFLSSNFTLNFFIKIFILKFYPQLFHKNFYPQILSSIFPPKFLPSNFTHNFFTKIFTLKFYSTFPPKFLPSNFVIKFDPKNRIAEQVWRAQQKAITRKKIIKNEECH